MLDKEGSITAVAEDELIPKSRKVPLGSGELPPNMSWMDYNYLVYDTRLTSPMKRSLLYYASRFNWVKRDGTWISLQRMANDLCVERKALGIALKELIKHDWVSAKKDKRGNFRVTIRVGNEIPELRWKEPQNKTTQIRREYGLES